MFGHRFFGRSYYGPRYFGGSGATPIVSPMPHQRQFIADVGALMGS
jgi:hypothetical protein